MAKQNHTDKSEGKKKPSVIKIILYVLGGLFVIGIIGSAGDAETTTETSDTTETTQDSAEIDKVAEEPKIQYQSVNLSDFVEEYDSNQISAQKKYTETYVTSSGYVSDISEGILGEIYVMVSPTSDEYYFGTKVQCYVSDDDSVTSLSDGGKVSFRGIVGDQSILDVPVHECEIL